MIASGKKGEGRNEGQSYVSGANFDCMQMA